MPKSRKCCVVGCDANNMTHRLFNFPKDDKLRELWLSQLIPVNIGLSGLSKAQLLNRYVCQKHFDRHQFDGMGNRLAHGYPCLFTEKEILHGIPLNSLAEHDFSDHNYALQPTFFSSAEVQHSKHSTVSIQSAIINAKDYKSEGSTETSTSLKIDGCTTVLGSQKPEIMEIVPNQPVSILKPVSTEMRCCVPFCKTTGEVVSESGEIIFHEFPREAHLRAAWLRALGKQDLFLPDKAMVCSLHFLNDDFYETESGSRLIHNDAVPSTVLVCMICMDTRSKLIPMSKNKLEEAYEHLVGRPRLLDFSKFRDKSLRAHSLLTDLVERHDVITIRHVKMISAKYQLQSDIANHCDAQIGFSDADSAPTVATDEAVAAKREVKDREDADTVDCAPSEDKPAAPDQAAETQAPIKREETTAFIWKLESLGDCNQALSKTTNFTRVLAPV